MTDLDARCAAPGPVGAEGAPVRRCAIGVGP